MREREVFDRAQQFRMAIRDFNVEYGTEIEAIAEAADIHPLWIYALNSRTELLALGAAAKVNECTALYFRKTSILGQNWDWGQRMEDLTVLMRIERPDGHVIRMIAEPGIIGKIGMNSAGVGACLNLLRCRETPDVGVPVHVVLRSILDANSLAEARQSVAAAGGGKASNILAGDCDGNFFDVEFAGRRTLFHDSEGDVVRHTNHYLCESSLDSPVVDLSNSRCRFDVAEQRSASLTAFGVDQMANVLSDQSDAEFPILRGYVPDDVVQEVGTVCTIAMELAEGRLHIRKGNDAADPLIEYTV